MDTFVSAGDESGEEGAITAAAYGASKSKGSETVDAVDILRRSKCSQSPQEIAYVSDQQREKTKKNRSITPFSVSVSPSRSFLVTSFIFKTPGNGIDTTFLGPHSFLLGGHVKSLFSPSLVVFEAREYFREMEIYKRDAAREMERMVASHFDTTLFFPFERRRGCLERDGGVSVAYPTFGTLCFVPTPRACLCFFDIFFCSTEEFAVEEATGILTAAEVLPSLSSSFPILSSSRLLPLLIRLDARMVRNREEAALEDFPWLREQSPEKAVPPPRKPNMLPFTS